MRGKTTARRGTRKVVRRRQRSVRGMRGTGIRNWLRKANKFLKKHKVLSRISGMYGKYGKDLGLPGTQYATIGSKLFKRAGYGLARSGGSLRRSGGALRRSGSMGRRRGCGRRRILR